MGVSRSPAELAAKFNRLTTIVPDATRDGVHSGAAATKKIIVTTAASRGVLPSSKIAGGKWSVGYDVRGRLNPTALVRIRGSFHLVESDTKLHIIAAKRLATRSAQRARLGEIALSGGGVKFGRYRSLRSGGGKRALLVNGSPRAYAVHPGTKGKHIFRDSVKRAERAVPPIIRTRLKIAMSQALN